MSEYKDTQWVDSPEARRANEERDKALAGVHDVAQLIRDLAEVRRGEAFSDRVAMHWQNKAGEAAKLLSKWVSYCDLSGVKPVSGDVRDNPILQLLKDSREWLVPRTDSEFRPFCAHGRFKDECDSCREPKMPHGISTVHTHAEADGHRAWWPHCATCWCLKPSWVRERDR